MAGQTETIGTIMSSGISSYSPPVGIAVLGSTVAAGIFGAIHPAGIGALPAAVWALPGAIAAGSLSGLLEHKGMSANSASLVSAAAIAVPALAGVALLKSHSPGMAGALLLTAVGAAGAGILGASWH